MTLEVFEPGQIPSYAQHVSSFNNDDRCYAYRVVVGESANEVAKMTKELYQFAEAIDYDVAYSFEEEKWVGTVVKDHE